MKRMKTMPTLSLLCTYLGCLALVMLRWFHVVKPQVVVITPEITSHISNFALSLMLCLLWLEHSGFQSLTQEAQS